MIATLILKELDSVFGNIAYSNQPDRVAQLAEHWASIPKVVGSIPTVAGIFFKRALCGYTLRVTSQATSFNVFINVNM